MSFRIPNRAERASDLRRKLTACCAIVVFGALMAGCGTNRVVATDEVGSDARLRHLIAIVEQPYSVDLFPTDHGGRLDERTVGQIKDFASRYQMVGRGAITVLIPSGGQHSGRGSGQVFAGIRRALAENGIHAPVSSTPYQVEDPSLAAPVRISFHAIKAKVTHRCGDWPNDLASGSTNEGWSNRTYWNFGCASQSMIAAQVDDPRDIAGPAGETPPDAPIRMRGIDALRKGADPGTGWKTQNTSIGGVGG